jgi:pyruvate dehydrogenase (quinone)
VLIDALVARTELAMPPAVTVEMAKGFTPYMTKAVMGGSLTKLLTSRLRIFGAERRLQWT